MSGGRWTLLASLLRSVTIAYLDPQILAIALHASLTIEHRATSAQAVVDILQWPELIPVTDLASARQPIEVIVEQGRGAWIMPHFGAFADVVEDLLAVQQAPTVDPRPGCSVGSQKRRQKRGRGRRLFGPSSWWDNANHHSDAPR